MTSEELARYLYKNLNIENFDADISLNGLQVSDSGKKIKKVAFAVDACLETFKRAVSEKADMIVVHHGLFWGKPLAITGSHYSRIKVLIDNDISLFACHLPLDAHPVLGNNACIARKIGLKETEQFCENIGCKGTLPSPMTCAEIVKKLGVRTDGLSLAIEGGKKENLTVGIVSGRATSTLDEAIAEGLDLFITGEADHICYHKCMENKINMLGLGHYETETFGIKALAGYVAEECGLETVFIDIPTRL